MFQGAILNPEQRSLANDLAINTNDPTRFAGQLDKAKNDRSCGIQDLHWRTGNDRLWPHSALHGFVKLESTRGTGDDPSRKFRNFA